MVAAEEESQYLESINRDRASLIFIAGAVGTKDPSAAGTEQVSFRLKKRFAAKALIKLRLVAEVT